MRISIPKPCHENWNDMSPEQQGAFCNVCSKVVVDFSVMSDDEVIAYLQNKQGEKTCGRFRASQLAPYELQVNISPVYARGGFRAIFTAALFIFFSSLFSCTNANGDTLIFNQAIADTADTAVYKLVTDSTTTEPHMLTGDVEMRVVNTDTTITDTIAVAPIDTEIITIPPVMGLIRVEPEPQPIIMGKIACTRPTKTENDSTLKKHHK